MFKNWRERWDKQVAASSKHYECSHCPCLYELSAFLGSENSVTKIFKNGKIWKQKPTKGHNSKSYGPFAPIPVYMIHPVIVHVYTNFQLSSFLRFWEIRYKKFQEYQNLKTYQGT